jgi:hypothetical protein
MDSIDRLQAALAAEREREIEGLKAREQMVIHAMQRGTELYEASHRQTVALPTYSKMACWLIAEIAALKAENERLRGLYNDLIMGIGIKCPGESRHETARRYIRERENTYCDSKQAGKEAE